MRANPRSPARKTDDEQPVPADGRCGTAVAVTAALLIFLLFTNVVALCQSPEKSGFRLFTDTWLSLGGGDSYDRDAGRKALPITNALGPASTSGLEFGGNNSRVIDFNPGDFNPGRSNHGDSNHGGANGGWSSGGSGVEDNSVLIGDAPPERSAAAKTLGFRPAHPQYTASFFASGNGESNFNVGRSTLKSSGHHRNILSKAAPSLFSCSRGNGRDFAANCESRPAIGITVWKSGPVPSSSNAGVSREPKPTGFQWGPALWQSVEMLVLEHTFRLASDRQARYLVVRRPFWRNYFASASHFNMDHWGDGDDFLVNYIGHPLQGSVTGNIFIQNDPAGRTAKFGKSSTYWQSRLKATAWAAVYSAYFEIGPILSEAALGNEGGYTYIPGCGFYPTCTKQPGRTYKPPTNNTGWVDFVVTPVIGLGWIVLEDAIESKIVDRLAQGRHTLKFNILRGALAPSRTMSNLLAGKLPWYRAVDEVHVNGMFGKSAAEVKSSPSWKDQPRWDLGIHVITLRLPSGPKRCSDCRPYKPGAGFNLAYHLSRLVYLSSEFNIFPGEKQATQQGFFGVRVGRSFHSWGVYSQARPGFIRYGTPVGPAALSQYESSTHFVFDLGGTIDYNTSPRSAFRVNLGTNLVRYPTHPDLNQPPVSVLSNEYVATQGGFYLSGGYVFRF